MIIKIKDEINFIDLIIEKAACENRLLLQFLTILSFTCELILLFILMRVIIRFESNNNR